MSIQSGVSLRPFNTFGMDEVAARYTVVESVDDAVALARRMQAGEIELPVRVLGGGSNVLLTGPVDELVVHNQIPGIQLSRSLSGHIALVEVGAGVGWHELVMRTLDMGLSGLENLALIPGTVGASPIQNIGAYGVEVKDTLALVKWLEWETGKIRTFNPRDCRFGYRTSIFKTELAGKGMIIGVAFKLNSKPELKLDYGAIREELDNVGISDPTPKDVAASVIRIRQSKLPDPAVTGNAGSFFKNPEVPAALFERLKSERPDLPGYPAGVGRMKIPAGWLIEQAGWKGRQMGGAAVHDRQALVLVNKGGAKGHEVLALASAVMADVEAKFGVQLEKEVQIW